MTRCQILSTVWGNEHHDDIEYLRAYAQQLRAKLGDDPTNLRYFETEPSTGYRLKAE
jgi:two-component system KDP operon response regulator KdpE